MCALHCLPTASITSVFAGVPGAMGAANGPALQATFSSMQGLSIASNGDIYIAEYSTCLVRKVSAGAVSAVAGSSCGAASNGPSNTAVFGNLRGVAVAANGEAGGCCRLTLQCCSGRPSLPCLLAALLCAVAQCVLLLMTCPAAVM